MDSWYWFKLVAGVSVALLAAGVLIELVERRHERGQ